MKINLALCVNLSKLLCSSSPSVDKRVPKITKNKDASFTYHKTACCSDAKTQKAFINSYPNKGSFYSESKYIERAFLFHPAVRLFVEYILNGSCNFYRPLTNVLIVIALKIASVHPKKSNYSKM